jgi:signal transduction histidine kinase
VVQVGLSLDQVRTSLANLLRVFLLSIPGLILVAGVGGYSLAGRALSPIDQITQTARRISARDLSARLNLPPGKDELGRLAATIDEMLGRLEGAFHREQRFVADASHELRTPLTAMQAILSVVRAKRRTIEDYEHALADIAEETDRLRALTENLLVLARTDMQPLAEIEPVDLSLLLTDLYSSMRPLATAKGLAMTNAVPPGLSLMGDRDGLTRLFINLIDNAIKYAQKGDVQIAAGRQDDTILWVTVFDTGCGIPEGHLSHIFERFYRVDPSRTSGGAGLGLAIAQEIAQNHEGNIRAESTVGVGTKFTVTLASRPNEIRGR